MLAVTYLHNIIDSTNEKIVFVFNCYVCYLFNKCSKDYQSDSNFSSIKYDYNF